MEMFMEDMVQQSIIAGGSLMFFLFLAFIPMLLCIILFFKIWIMTNDVSRIKAMLQEQLDLEHPYVEDSKDSKPDTNTVT